MSLYDPSSPLESVEKRGWLLSMTVTIAYFSVSLYLTVEPMFSTVIASGAGIGFQYFLPYFVAWQILEREGSGAESQLHQGAAGIGLVAGSVVALPSLLITGSNNISLLIGGIVIVVGYFVLARLLPDL